MPGQSFERDIVHAFNDYADATNTRLIAYRHYQMRFQPQFFDVLVDSRSNELYLALECKSVDTSSVPGLYFKQHFTWQKGVCQVKRENDWLTKSGRNGFLVVEARRPKPNRTGAFFVPWRSVWHCFNVSDPIIHQDLITGCPYVEKRAGKYTLDDDFINEMIKYLDSYPKREARLVRRKW